MASKYAKPLQVPAEFPDVLRSFAREVLRQQGKVETQEGIFEFGAQYFRDLLDKRNGGASKASGGAGGPGEAPLPVYMQLSEEEVRSIVLNAFESVNRQEDEGLISFNDIREIVYQLAEQLQFSPSELRALFADADENDEGFIAFNEYVPLAVQATLMLRETRTHRLARAESFRNNHSAQFLHGMTQDEMESLLRDIFQRMDQDGGDNGGLPRVAFMDAIRDADLGFTRREVNILMAEAPLVDSEPTLVSYQDFVPVCFPILQECFGAGVLELPNEQDSLTQFLLEVFASGDSDATGLLTVADLARLLRAADIGLTRLQIVIAMAEAQEDKSGFVHYEKFAGHVAGMLLVLLHLDAQPALAAYVLQYRQSGEFYTVLDMNEHAFEQTLARALEAADEDRRGLLGREEIAEAIGNALPELNQRQLRALLALAEPNEMGEREYMLITHSAFQTLQKLQEYDRMIMES